LWAERAAAQGVDVDAGGGALTHAECPEEPHRGGHGLDAESPESTAANNGKPSNPGGGTGVLTNGELKPLPRTMCSAMLQISAPTGRIEPGARM